MAAALASAVLISACVHPRGLEKPLSPAQIRREAIRRAQVWKATDVGSMDIRMGPQIPGAFAPDEEINCDFVDRKPDGHSAKFYCAIAPDDEVKIKYGRSNGEVYAEVAATRLLWALGFPADAMYPVRVVCRGCPADPFHRKGARAEKTVFEFAAAERKFPGTPVKIDGEEGWTWPELDLVDESAGGAPRPQRDALRLLAVFLQDTDTKAEQQRVICADKRSPRERGEEACLQPMMMLNDLGQTFGRANLFNRDRLSGMIFDRWSRATVWKDPTLCVGNLPQSFSGTLNNPRISEAGRRFLADLLGQLSDAQLYDLFEIAHATSRTIDGSHAGEPSVDQWVSAFKKKRDEIANRSCDPNTSRLANGSSL